MREPDIRGVFPARAEKNRIWLTKLCKLIENQPGRKPGYNCNKIPGTTCPAVPGIFQY
jgi:hypothetical protein